MRGHMAKLSYPALAAMSKFYFPDMSCSTDRGVLVDSLLHPLQYRPVAFKQQLAAMPAEGFVDALCRVLAGQRGRSRGRRLWGAWAWRR